jgi:MurNAc alpha-1-phosphate uridylyltransferase
VNVHYLASSVEAHLASRAKGLEIVISDERDLLLENRRRTGKGAALHRLRPFLAVNSDNLWIDGPPTR